MSRHLPEEKTTVVSTFSNRQDAEIARARLAEYEIDAMIVADDVHPPFQLTEGAKLLVLDQEVDRARHVLEETSMSVDQDVASDRSARSTEESANLTFGLDGFVQATAGTYLTVFVLMVAMILTGLLVGL
ncbi:hypothetical protein CRI94_11840 [Longibacter salinarum]|uniref:DUF2007 domain-containing protein n=1 Tax=Longibacter salinarum TaxID=1850348 RepID=A0A2A8CVS2_9BACT|nr:hypothetical protein [Longibacter salinarum]PEN12713.1 hypothetical protein CRI94_11840 [Longibacter salinarum]